MIQNHLRIFRRNDYGPEDRMDQRPAASAAPENGVGAGGQSCRRLEQSRDAQRRFASGRAAWAPPPHPPGCRTTFLLQPVYLHEGCVL